jgi:hypothetical protein
MNWSIITYSSAGYTAADHTHTHRSIYRSTCLSAVDEVSELRLPNHQRVGVLQRVAHLEAEHSELGENGVADRELGLHIWRGLGLAQRQRRRGVPRQMVQRHVLLAAVLIHDRGVAVRKGAALHVLAGEAHVVAFEQKSADREGLRGAPINAFALEYRVQARLDDLLQLLVDGEALGHRAHLHADVLQLVHFHARLSNAGQLPRR